MREHAFNPFPGLRSFEPEEEHLFFGREQQVDDLLRRLRSARFLAVVGASGSGKSSLVRSGLIPALYSGYMAPAGSSWRIALLRPGTDPIGNLAAALAEPAVVGAAWVPDDMHRPLLEATLRRSALGVAESVRHARIAPHENVLIVVDQFEELFRFKQARATPEARDEAVAFVKLLVEAMRQDTAPIYVVLTMRSEFIGQCAQFAGLASAVNEGQYLVPRMTRDELRLAITGPVAVGGGEITPRLVTRLLNDVGDDPDHLPILQHALMRTWDYADAHDTAMGPLDLPHYEAIGTMQHALSRHADEAYGELTTEAERQIAEGVFKALVEMTPQAGGVRRPCRVAELCDVTDAGRDHVLAVIDRFRMSGRSFLTPSSSVPLEESTIVDLSHESLIRLWTRLIDWTAEDARSAEQYRRVSQAAVLHARQEAALWRDPELQLALNWRDAARPGRAWAERYAPGFDQAIAFLEQSRAARDEEVAERDRQAAERRQLRRRQWIAARVAVAVLLVLCIVSVTSLIFARNARDEALVLRAAADNQRLVAQDEATKARVAEEEARRQGALALRQEQRAVAEQSRAERESANAQAAARTAVEQRGEAQRQAAIADQQRIEADTQRMAADAARMEAENSSRLAESNAAEARKAQDEAVQLLGQRTRLQSLALSRALAGQATRQFDTSAVPALLAREAYNLAAANGGDPESPEIVTALRQSLESFAADTVRVYLGHGDAVRAIAVSPDGTTFATAGDDGQVRLLDIGETTSRAAVVGALGSPARSIAFDRKGVLLAGGTLDGLIHMWTVVPRQRSLRLIKSWNAHSQAVSYLAFDSRNNLVSVGFDGQVRVWQGDGFVLQPSPWEAQPRRFLAAALSHRGDRLAVATDGAGVLLGSVDTPAGPPMRIGGSARMTSVAFSPDDRWLVGGTAGGQVLYWELTRPQAPVREVAVHRAAVTALQFGGGLLGSAALDGEVRVWPANPEALDRPPVVLEHGAWVWALAFNPSGDGVLSAGADGRVRAWPTSARRLAEEVCRRVGRSLTEAEWKLYVADVPYTSTCPDTVADGRRP